MEIKEELIQIMDTKQAENIVTLDFREHSPFVDYFLIGSVRNARMAASIIDNIEEYCANKQIKVKHIDNHNESKWFLIDIGEIVVHLFYDGEREKYDLEGLWRDMILK